MERDIVVKHAGLKYFVLKRVKKIWSVVTRKWKSRNPKLYLHPIDTAWKTNLFSGVMSNGIFLIGIVRSS